MELMQVTHITQACIIVVYQSNHYRHLTPYIYTDTKTLIAVLIFAFYLLITIGYTQYVLLSVYELLHHTSMFDNREDS